MSSFWEKSDGQKATGEVKENNFSPLPKAWYPILIEEFKISEYEGARKLQVKARVISGYGTNRVVFLNVKVFLEGSVTPKQRDRAIDLFSKMHTVFKIPMPDHEPDDAHLSRFIDKSADFFLDVWELDGNDGNWLVNVEPKGSKSANAAAVAVKAGATQGKAANAPAQRTASSGGPSSDMDSDIPFAPLNWRAV